MRTTIDIPEELLRRVKAQAALRGMKLKDLVSEALRAMLEGRLLADAVAEEPGGDEADETRLVMGKDCSFPLIKGSGGPALKDLTPEKVSRILEDEEVEGAHLPRRR